MRDETIAVARGARGRRLTDEELAAIETRDGSEGVRRVRAARAAYAVEDALVDASLKGFFVRQKEFGKEHNYAYQKCRRDTVIFFRSLVLALVMDQTETLVTEVNTWFVTILQTVRVHLEDTYHLWAQMKKEIDARLDAQTAGLLAVPLRAAMATVEQAMVASTSGRVKAT